MCSHPLNLGDRIVKCGHCIECLIARSSEWAFRLEQEMKDAVSGVFLTLTYDDNNAIWIDSEGHTVTTLHKKDWQDFMKRVRHYQGTPENKQDWKQKPRYFMCGEYGPQTGRAHYHAIIFNLKKSVIKKLDKIWNKGFIKVGDVTPLSIRYVTNYMLLKDNKVLDNQVPPFVLMSKKPIIGARYVINNYFDHKDGQSGELKIPGKSVRNLYKCYERKIFTDKEREKLKEHRMQAWEAWQQDKMKIHEEKEPLDPYAHQKQVKLHNAYIIKKRQKQRKL